MITFTQTLAADALLGAATNGEAAGAAAAGGTALFGDVLQQMMGGATSGDAGVGPPPIDEDDEAGEPASNELVSEIVASGGAQPIARLVLAPTWVAAVALAAPAVEEGPVDATDPVLGPVPEAGLPVPASGPGSSPVEAARPTAGETRALASPTRAAGVAVDSTLPELPDLPGTAAPDRTHAPTPEPAPTPTHASTLTPTSAQVPALGAPMRALNRAVHEPPSAEVVPTPAATAVRTLDRTVNETPPAEVVPTPVATAVRALDRVVNEPPPAEVVPTPSATPMLALNRAVNQPSPAEVVPAPAATVVPSGVPAPEVAPPESAAAAAPARRTADPSDVTRHASRVAADAGQRAYAAAASESSMTDSHSGFSEARGDQRAIEPAAAPATPAAVPFHAIADRPAPPLSAIRPAPVVTASEVINAAVATELPAQVVQSLRMQAIDGGGEAIVRLRPEYLGELVVAVKVEHGVVSASLRSDTPAVRQWVESNEATLRQALAEHGLQLDRLTVSDAAPQTEAGEGERQDSQEQDEEPQPRSRRRRKPAPDATFEVMV